MYSLSEFYKEDSRGVSLAEEKSGKNLHLE